MAGGARWVGRSLVLASLAVAAGVAVALLQGALTTLTALTNPEHQNQTVLLARV